MLSGRNARKLSKRIQISRHYRDVVLVIMWLSKMAAASKYKDYRDRENVIIVSSIMELTLPGESRPLKMYIYHFEFLKYVENWAF